MKDTRRSIRQHNPWLLWLMLWVALFAALAPTVSHALARGATPVGFEICTAQGAQAFAPDADASSADSSGGQQSGPSLQHCPFCLHPADRVAPPSCPLPCLLLVQGGPQDVAVWQASFFKRIYARWLEPRGPPD